MTPQTIIDGSSTMAAILAVYPGAQRALFRKYHVGGCSSCGFQQEETLGQVCARNSNLDVAEVISHIRASHEQDAALLLKPKELSELRAQNPALRMLDIRSREEHEAARIEGSQLISQELMQEVMGRWPKDELVVIIDHDGTMSADAAAYFLGHGLTHVRILQGGIDAWSQEVDPSIPRYRLA